jgi:hypothetical protein
MLCAIGASFVFQVFTRPMVGCNWVVSGMVVVVLDSVMDSVLDPNRVTRCTTTSHLSMIYRKCAELLTCAHL